eukprot:gnl/MRDRNA2_/MRDRNA2_51332_c0_seq2.p1 gnl/MRDRNA2_/MRDRNA2_51332_c0~~gnl/MRDRNA2_/MRDRNA2_51332_c0_seq2.p1  ORF type:complete len:104 (-),score=0.52 gnl/MRDRNA2_/MRDRNA2_51332_c0_seq2:261-551(-)
MSSVLFLFCLLFVRFLTFVLSSFLLFLFLFRFVYVSLCHCSVVSWFRFMLFHFVALFLVLLHFFAVCLLSFRFDALLMERQTVSMYLQAFSDSPFK